MADLQKISNVSAQVEYDISPLIKTSNVSAQVEYDIEGKIKVSNLSGQVEYDDTPPEVPFELYVLSGGSWTEITNGWILDGGVWKYVVELDLEESNSWTRLI